MSDQALATANAEQTDLWNRRSGPNWVRYQTLLDTQLDPLGAEALRVLAPQPGERILDIGCGCGQTTLQLADAVGPGGGVVGVDVSEPMLELARSRAGDRPAAFRNADAQTADLGPRQFDAAFSRFGVMFFDDPSAAFGNIRAALKPGGRLSFVCWRSRAENPVLVAPFETALPLLPPQPPADPLAPGPFAFADADRLRGVLADAGFDDVALTPFDRPVGGGGVEDQLELALNIGPLGVVLRENPDYKPKVVDAVRAMLTRYQTPGGVLLPAAVWIVQARA